MTLGKLLCLYFLCKMAITVFHDVTVRLLVKIMCVKDLPRAWYKVIIW